MAYRTYRFRFLRLFFVLIAMAIMAAATVEAETGFVRVVDGDTIHFESGTRVRLSGVDAPEKMQTCLSETGFKWKCGKFATDQLKELLGGKTVSCTFERRPDLYGREIGLCTVEKISINAWLVSNGLAEVDLRFNKQFVPLEADAVRAKVGIWQGKHVSPRLWRKGIRE